MKIDKAIELLALADTWPQEVKKDDLGDAIKLGKEALKRYKEDRYYEGIMSPKLLPGEDTD